MIDLYGRGLLLGALVIFLNGLFFSIFSLVISEPNYITIFMLFAIFNFTVGIVIVFGVYLKLYLITKRLLNDDNLLKEVLEGKK